MRLPDFFILGAPRCGTTALRHYLRTHPDVFMPKRELNYFSFDFPDLFMRPRSHSDYLALYRSAPETCVRGDGSATYLLSEVAVPAIIQENPEAKLIVLLRDPTAAAHSFHSQLLYSFQEDEPDFRVALDKQNARRRGHDIPRTCTAPAHLQYTDVYRYSRQIERLFAAAPKQNVLVFVFEDFTANLKESYADVLEFLGVRQEIPQQFPVVNENKTWRLRSLARFLRHPPAPLDRLVAPLRAASQTLGLHPRSTLGRINSRRVRRSPLDPELRAQLQEAFSDDISRVEQLLGRDLSVWRQ